MSSCLLYFFLGDRLEASPWGGLGWNVTPLLPHIVPEIDAMSFFWEGRGRDELRLRLYLDSPVCKLRRMRRICRFR